MRFVSIMSWEPEKAKEVTELFLKWKPPEGFKFLYGPCTVLGGNKTVSIIETDTVALAKIDRYWREVTKSEIWPIMDTADIAKMKP